MPMREECKHFQSRTYASGEVARICELDLAPEAPWRCPENCASYERRMADAGWTHGSLVSPPSEAEPVNTPPGEIASLLEQAEDIVNAVVPETRKAVLDDRARESESPLRRLARRIGRRPKPSGDDQGSASH